jgi:GTP1/Obg family GTP-binding protein
MNFEIDPNSLCQVTIREQYSMYKHIKQEDLTPDQVFKIIKGEDICTTTSSDDHPEFKELRNTLEDQGFIKTERTWWNGDRVLKTFTLNGAIFRKGEKFCSGAAIKWDVDHKEKDKNYRTI